jgi:hypothetical protein
VTSLAGFLPQVSQSCSGAVVVGSGTVVVGGPLGGVTSALAAVLVNAASAAVPARPIAAPATTTLLMNWRRESPAFSERLAVGGGSPREHARIVHALGR